VLLPLRWLLALRGLRQVMVKFGSQHTLGQLLLELGGQLGFAGDRFDIPVLDLRQQLVDQLIWSHWLDLRFLRLLGCIHCVGHGGSVSIPSHDLFTQKSDRLFLTFLSVSLHIAMMGWALCRAIA
jgi:hypothetical protein